MKKFKTWFVLFAALFMSFTFVGCDLFDSDDEEEEQAAERSVNDYFRMEITRCERIGYVLVIDYNIRNITKTHVQNFKFYVNDSYVVDNLGNKYRGGHFENSINRSRYSTSMNPTPILAGEKLTGSFRIIQFDPTNTAKSVSLYLKIYCPEFNFDGASIVGTNFNITDNRILAKGILTNDTNMEWKYLGAERTSDGDAILKLSVKNNTGRTLQNFTIPNDHQAYIGKVLENCVDDMGQSYYYNIEIALGQGKFNNLIKTDFQANETKTIRIRIPHMDPNAKSIKGDMFVDSRNYAFEDNFAHLLNLPLK